MTTLHTYNSAPHDSSLWQQMALALRSGDMVLLIENGTYYLQHSTLHTLIDEHDVTVSALRDDADARGVLSSYEQVKLVEYGDFVRLAAECDKVVAWY